MQPNESSFSTFSTTPLSSLTSQYGVSDTLKSMFEGLRETPGISGNKFSEQHINKFAQYIVCRNYGKLCLELSYFLFFITNYKNHISGTQNRSKSYDPDSKLSTSQSDNSLLTFFWIEESFTVHRFKTYFSEPYQHSDFQLVLSSAHLTLTWSEKSAKSFSISPTRAGILAVLFEFLMMIKPALIEQAQASLFSGDEKQIKALSSLFQKELYAFLMDHLTVAQVQRRYRYITQWLHQQGYDEKFLSDECILQFWQMVNDDNQSDNSLSFKLYSAVVDDLISLDSAIKHSKNIHEIEHSMAIGSNAEQGEIPESLLQSIVFDYIESEYDYEFLTADPKFLTQSQWQVLQPLVKYRHYQEMLALSFARLATFSPWQAILIQAKRRSLTVVKDKLAIGSSHNYDDFVAQFNTLKNVILDVLLSLTYIDFTHHKTAAVTELFNALAPEYQRDIKQQLKHQLTELSQQGSDSEQQIFNAFENVLAESTELQKQLQQAKKAFTKNNKSGFKSLPDESDLPIYHDGQAALQHIHQLLKQQIKTYQSLWKNDDAQTKFHSDTFIFKQSFEKMYCVGE